MNNPIILFKRSFSIIPNNLNFGELFIYDDDTKIKLYIGNKNNIPIFLNSFDNFHGSILDNDDIKEKLINKQLVNNIPYLDINFKIPNNLLPYKYNIKSDGSDVTNGEMFLNILIKRKVITGVFILGNINLNIQITNLINISGYFNKNQNKYFLTNNLDLYFYTNLNSLYYYLNSNFFLDCNYFLIIDYT
jgi:hypothetical protein